MLQSGPFRGLGKREAVNPVDYFNYFAADFNLFHQGSDQLPFCRPVHLVKIAVHHLGKCLELANHNA